MALEIIDLTDSLAIEEKGAVSLIDEMGKLPCCPFDECLFGACHQTNPEADECYRYKIIHTTTGRLIRSYGCSELNRAKSHVDQLGNISIPDNPEEISDFTKQQIVNIIFAKKEGQE